LRTFPGKRVLPTRAWIMATILTLLPDLYAGRFAYAFLRSRNAVSTFSLSR
jgi:hypothetical protein